MKPTPTPTPISTRMTESDHHAVPDCLSIREKKIRKEQQQVQTTCNLQTLTHTNIRQKIQKTNIYNKNNLKTSVYIYIYTPIWLFQQATTWCYNCVTKQTELSNPRISCLSLGKIIEQILNVVCRVFFFFFFFFLSRVLSVKGP